MPLSTAFSLVQSQPAIGFGKLPVAVLDAALVPAGHTTVPGGTHCSRTGQCAMGPKECLPILKKPKHLIQGKVKMSVQSPSAVHFMLTSPIFLDYVFYGFKYTQEF